MPRCKGRRNERCNRNDSTVRFTQGDLFLCRDCEEFRFPTKVVDTKRSAAARNKLCPDADTTGKKNQKSKVKSRNAKTKTSSAGADSDSDTDIYNQNVQCASCLGPIDSIARTACAICAGVYHLACSGIPGKSVINFLIWQNM